MDGYEHDFAFSVSGDREPSVYHCASTMRTSGRPFHLHTGDLRSWLAELVDAGGVYPRPALE
ncbi:hypothetical protein [Marinactinospora rubrisoli]|uniref:Uncharacterized protein n=1 Tax=Marinactinospora rubrisoli TaxID=2715399 RepID=A0ABW2KHM6_9ACTN